MNHFHKQMLRQKAAENPLKSNQLKKRRKPTADIPKEEIIVSSSDSDDDLEDIDLSCPSIKDSTPLSAAADDSDAFEDLEDVDLDAAFGQTQSKIPESETLTFTIQANEEVKAKKGKKFDTIPKEERHMRKLVHKLYIQTMVAHGALRNLWCNDPAVTASLRSLLPPLNAKLLNEKWVSGKENVLARRFVLALLKAQEIYSKKFKVTCQGLVRKDWGDMMVKQNHIAENVNRAKFASLVNSLQGSRDVGAQGFVALLRSYGVHCRLVFSLQPPDFRSVLPAVSSIEKKEKAEKEKMQKPRSEFDPIFIPNAKQEVLGNARTRTTSTETSRRQYKFPMSRYPIFWAEAWNKFSRKWITIDPIVFECVEVMPMRKKCKFEPAGTEKTHQSQYVLAFDKFGKVRDVTRRYTLNYNANVIKKRIDAVSDEDEHWYRMVLKGASTRFRSFGQAEAFELKEFHDRDISEGIPKSKKGFKNHPIYALESELRQDEVIYPKDDSSKCGTFRSANKNTIEPIYKRSHVYRIRTAKAWHMRGRVLKIGALPLKTKKVNPMDLADDDESDGETRLYAEFQTQLYIPPPIVDGKITKNAFGNIEIFTESMIPVNGYLIKVTEKASMRTLEKAARDVLRIDYAKAIVAFDFGKKGATTPKEGGVLIDVQFKDAMNLVVEGLINLEEEDKRKGVELNALRCWKFFLAKLRIMRRLDRDHGKISQPVTNDDKKEDSDAEEGYFSVASEVEGSSGEENYVPRKRRKYETVEDSFPTNDLSDEGGFVLGDANLEPNSEANQNSSECHTISSDREGGFFIEANDESDSRAGNDINGITSNPGVSGDQETYELEGGFLGGHKSEESDHMSDDQEGGFLPTLETNCEVESHRDEHPCTFHSQESQAPENSEVMVSSIGNNGEAGKSFQSSEEYPARHFRQMRSSEACSAHTDFSEVVSGNNNDHSSPNQTDSSEVVSVDGNDYSSAGTPQQHDTIASLEELHAAKEKSSSEKVSKREMPTNEKLAGSLPPELSASISSPKLLRRGSPAALHEAYKLSDSGLPQSDGDAFDFVYSDSE